MAYITQWGQFAVRNVYGRVYINLEDWTLSNLMKFCSLVKTDVADVNHDMNTIASLWLDLRITKIQQEGP